MFKTLKSGCCVLTGALASQESAVEVAVGINKVQA
jgi:hypothetical protein